MPFPKDGHLLPGHGRAEKPEKRTRLAEMLEGGQIATLDVDAGPGPTGSPVMGIELATGVRLAIMAARDRNSRYRVRLIFRLMPARAIWTPDDERRSRFGRPANEYDPDPKVAAMQRRVEGEVIRGLIQQEEPTSFGGEAMAMEFRNGARLSLAAGLIEEVGKTPRPDIIWDYKDPPRRSLLVR